MVPEVWFTILTLITLIFLLEHFPSKRMLRIFGLKVNNNSADDFLFWLEKT